LGWEGTVKSQLLFEFTHNQLLKDERYDSSLVFFIDATTSATLVESYALIAKAQGVGSSAKDAVTWLLNTRQPTLILMDNADNPKIVFKEYMPRSTYAQVLITTQLLHADRDYANNEDASIHLDALTLSEAEELLIKMARLSLDRREGVSDLVQVFSMLCIKAFNLKKVFLSYRNYTAMLWLSFTPEQESAVFISLSLNTQTSSVVTVRDSWMELCTACSRTL
jgi:hypothetical protein